MCLEQGPCNESEWLEPESNGYGVCRLSPCPASKIDGRHIYWKPAPVPSASAGEEAGCYKSFTKGPCKAGSYFLVEDLVSKKARCVIQRPYRSSRNGRSRFPFLNSGWNPYPSYSGRARMNSWSGMGSWPMYGVQDYGADYQDYDMFF